MIPDPPKSLPKVAADEWGRVCDLLQRAGSLDRTAVSAIESHCRLWALFSEMMRRAGRRKGTVVVHPHNQVAGLSHEFKAAMQLQSRLAASFKALGIVPAAQDPEQHVAPPAASAGKPAGDSGLDLSPGPDDE